MLRFFQHYDVVAVRGELRHDVARGHDGSRNLGVSRGVPADFKIETGQRGVQRPTADVRLLLGGVRESEIGRENGSLLVRFQPRKRQRHVAPASARGEVGGTQQRVDRGARHPRYRRSRYDCHVPPVQSHVRGARDAQRASHILRQLRALARGQLGQRRGLPPAHAQLGQRGPRPSARALLHKAALDELAQLRVVALLQFGFVLRVQLAREERALPLELELVEGGLDLALDLEHVGADLCRCHCHLLPPPCDGSTRSCNARA
mmetsp:Transcript_26730/g.67739  ORF Transcript_26730/g.67739 Transcript_26730/m.67739 type:complete len:262 (+) Transcript_26730:1138-1923(+)